MRFSHTFFKIFKKMPHTVIHQNMLTKDGLLKDNAFQAYATRKRHIHLAMRKCPVTDIDNHLIERFSLRFMDGHRPGQP